MSHFRLARLCLLLAAVGLNAAPALMTSAHAQKDDAQTAKSANSVRPELYKLIDPAQVQPLIAAKNVAELQKRMTQADALPNKTPFEAYSVNRLKMVTASLAGDDAGVLAAAEQVLNSGLEPKESQPKLLLAMADINYNKTKNYGAAVEQLKRYEAMGGDMSAARQLLSRALYLGKDYAGAKPQLLQLIDGAEKAGKAPTEEDLKLLRSAAHETKDNAAYETALQKLVTYYPNDNWWDELIRVGVIRKPGYDQNNFLPVLRLRFAATKALSEEEYIDLADTTQRDFPTEAKNVLDAGYAAGILGKGPNAKAHNALRDKVNKSAADDARNIAGTEAKAKTGTGLVNLGWAYATMGQYDKGIGFMQQGIAKGGLKQPDEAKLRLGAAQAKAGKKDEAIKTFESVKAGGGLSNVARIWIMSLKQPTAGAAPAATAAAAPTGK